ncbi:sensor histidine kinase [Lawsonibacter faecis]|uniref:histidine kinase n=1 Tax=Lawsonibacter faecis TaxID=2763052 RepID=A0A8J6JBZ2_9FIRM|nr:MULTISPECIES: ATP-binding protein [Oscillospiraceae]MTQ97542.1 HAMP domain-containing protein [Pseudoflavonifractor sp. BIOML-A16]MTR06495.1 HAMP domain-containing protein [Pseudoflavonifractor sp. BIOML-A15]MTR74648.1 HAMP domain-containing protein [Pseudoflavonifractor sp. BIOML-A18]MTS64427.1 HAMP domain-containing protein [Pseudoflavonifractor sp. BIOML-A5]MTS72609.1 HAMP domain-containing protein [Pseudoflavonifractor sp. BIOML-A8]MTS90155.1 HAMP domain-containing protein [Pseudoflavo
MKKRLIGATLVTVLVALLVSSAAGVWVFHQREMAAARQNLEELLILMDAQSAITDPEGIIEQFVQAAPEKRLTIIDVDGTVLADTEADPAAMENHADRSEVRQAALTGWGEALRPSESVGVTMLYEAKRFADGMVGRASMNVSSIDSLVLNSAGGFLAAALVALVVALLMASRMARMVLRPLNVVGDALQGVLDGNQDREALTRYEGDDEVRPLLRYIDKLVERLGDHINQIRAERDKVSLILECMDEGLILLDEAGSVLALNRAAKRLFGVGEDSDGSSVLLLTRSRALRQALQTVRADKTPVVLDIEDLAFGERSLRMFLSPVSGRQYEGESVGCSILISDVTDLKRAEGIRSEFTANVSHELKTPLTSIKGFTDMLSTGMVKDPEDQKRFFSMIGVEVDRLIELINDILKLSELESVAIEQCEERADVLEAAKAAETLLSQAAASAGITLSVAGMPAEAAIPAGRLKELMLNLMENGVKYNEPGGRVDVRVSADERFVTATVSDTGIGIPEEARQRIFERFYRVDKGRARKNGGTGLGLAIVKHILQLYGGSVSVESEPGRGSAFTVKLPRGKSEF